jgi:hypothetical protein
MKKASKTPYADMRDEYDFSAMGPGVRGKYARHLKGRVLVAVDADLAEAFPTSEEINRALRSVLEARGTIRTARPVAKRAVRRDKP